MPTGFWRGNVEENSLLEVDWLNVFVANPNHTDCVDDMQFTSSEDEYYDGGNDLCDWGNHNLDSI